MKSRAALGLAAAGFAIAVAGAVLVRDGLRRNPLPAGELPHVLEAPAAAPLPAFRLQGPRGEVDNSVFAGRWTFLFFGYTSCPDVCPTALALMKDLHRLVAAGAAVSPAPTFQVIFVSVDPRRDTRELLDAYLAAFDPGLIGLRGDDAALAPLAGALRVNYRRDDAKGGTNYTVDHSATIHLIDPAGRAVAEFPPPQEAVRMAEDFRRLTAERKADAR